MVTLSKTLITYPNAPKLANIKIQSCLDGDTCTTIKGGKIKLAYIYIPNLQGKKADLISAKAAKDHANDAISSSKVTIRRIKENKYGRTVAELFKGSMNIQEQLVEKGFFNIYERNTN